MKLPRTVRLNNARNIGIALKLYIHDMESLQALKKASMMLARSHLPDAGKGEGLWRQSCRCIRALQLRGVASVVDGCVVQGGP